MNADAIRLAGQPPNVLPFTIADSIEPLPNLEPQTLNQQVSCAIRQRRKAQGLTLRQLSERSGLSLGHLSHIEQGWGLSLRTLHRLATGLDTTMATLLGGIGRDAKPEVRGRRHETKTGTGPQGGLRQCT